MWFSEVSKHICGTSVGIFKCGFPEQALLPEVPHAY